MSITTSTMLKKVHFGNNAIRVVMYVFIAIITGIAIANSKWIYLSILLIPFLLYLCIEKPFVFPFGLYAFILPLDSIFVLSEVGRGPALTKFLALLIISVLLLKGIFEKKLTHRIDPAAILWTLFVLLLVVSFFWAINPQASLAQIRNPVGILIFYLLVSSYKINIKEYETLKWFIIGGGIFAGLFSLFNYQQLYNDPGSLDRVEVTIGEHSSGLNSLAFALLLPIAVCLEKILEQRTKLIKGTLYISLGVILFSMVLTGSRGSMLGAIIIFAVTILSIKQKISYIVVLIIIAIVLVPFIPDFFYERWGVAVESGGSGRIDIWYIGLMSLKKYFLIGAGLGNFPIAFDEFIKIPNPEIGYARAPHNTFLGIFVELGIIGMSLMILAMWKSYRKIQPQIMNKYIANSVILKAAFWGMVIASLTADSTFDKSFWLLLMMISMHSNLQIHNNLPYKSSFLNK